jgi:hypothetical protein
MRVDNKLQRVPATSGRGSDFISAGNDDAKNLAGKAKKRKRIAFRDISALSVKYKIRSPLKTFPLKFPARQPARNYDENTHPRTSSSSSSPLSPLLPLTALRLFLRSLFSFNFTTEKIPAISSRALTKQS